MAIDRKFRDEFVGGIDGRSIFPRVLVHLVDRLDRRRFLQRGERERRATLRRTIVEHRHAWLDRAD
ncbi:MAG TPA: hypothetical protein VHZ24_19790 [Pirellulales bacterium]|nr:hypothetical protein [Pirellulales bacterium]